MRAGSDRIEGHALYGGALVRVVQRWPDDSMLAGGWDLSFCACIRYMHGMHVRLTPAACMYVRIHRHVGTSLLRCNSHPSALFARPAHDQWRRCDYTAEEAN